MSTIKLFSNDLPSKVKFGVPTNTNPYLLDDTTKWVAHLKLDSSTGSKIFNFECNLNWKSWKMTQNSLKTRTIFQFMYLLGHPLEMELFQSSLFIIDVSG